MTRAFVFPGQGAQYVGMGMDLAERYPEARAVLDEADEVLGYGLSDLMAHGPSDELTRTDRSQPAILTASWMAHAVLQRQVPINTCSATAGLSLGEYSALLAAGVLDFADALRLVQVRGEAMQAAAEAEPSGMVALIGTDEAGATALCEAVADGEVLTVANLNSPGQVVVSGTSAACERAVAAARDHGIRRAMPLPVAGAFHSPLMQPAAERLRAAIDDVALRDPRWPVYTNVTAEAVRAANAVPELLVRQLTEPVRWAACVEAMHADGITTFWELGPGKTLSGMIARIVTGVAIQNIDQGADVDLLIGSVTD